PRNISFIVVCKSIHEQQRRGQGRLLIRVLVLGHIQSYLILNPQIPQFLEKRPSRQGGGFAATVDEEAFIIQPTANGVSYQQVEKSREVRAEAGELGNVPKYPVADGQAVLSVILVQEFGLEAGHIDVGGAFTLAGFTFQAQVEGFG